MKRRGVAVLLAALIPVLVSAPVADAKITKEMIAEFQVENEASLNSNDPVERAHAILTLGLINDKKINARLEPFLDNTNREVRLAAIVALASNKEKKGLAALDKEIDANASARYVLLTELLPQLPEAIQVDTLKAMTTGKDARADERRDALRYIAEHGQGKVYELLGEITKVKTGSERKPYADVLLQYPRPEAFGWAEKLLAAKKDEDARLTGLQLAVKIGGPKADGVARIALNDGNPQFRLIGLDYLEARKDPAATDKLMSNLKDAKSDGDRLAVIERLLKSGVKIPLAPAKALLDGGSNNAELMRAYHRLFGATGSADAVERLVKLEQSTNIEERRNAVIGLAYTKTPVGSQVLSRTIYDGDEEVRRLSVEGMGVLADPSTVKVLTTALNKAREKDIQYGIVRSLGFIKSDEAANALIFKVKDRDVEIKRLALQGLSRIRSKQTLSVLDVLVTDTDDSIRFQATLLQAELDKDKGIKNLNRALQRPPEGYMDQIGELPMALRDELLLFLLKHETPRLRNDAWDAILLLDQQGFTLIRTVAIGGYPDEIRGRAIDLLSQRNDAADVELFKNLAQTGNDAQKLLAMRWLLRRAAPDTSVFFRTLMNGFRGDQPKRAVARFGYFKSER